MITQEMVDTAEELARKLKHAKEWRYVVTDASLKEDLKLPTVVGRKLAERGLFYKCSGCPEWHIRPASLPEGMTTEAFIKLMQMLRTY